MLLAVLMAALVGFDGAAAQREPGDAADTGKRARSWAAHPPIVVPLHTNGGSPGYGLWAAGARYKVGFADAATFVPYLGAAAPETVTFTWRTTALRFGAVEVPLAAAPAPRAVTGLRVEYDLGAVVEAWDVRAEGLEQTFVVRRRPAAGDLLLRGEVSTSLACAERGFVHAPLSFGGDVDEPVLRYGAAIAIDAAGRRTAVQSRFDGGAIELRVDGAWLEGAAFPVVVDPLIENVSIAVGDVVAADAVRDPSAPDDALWVAYERAASALDSDVLLLRTDDAFAAATLGYADLSAGWSTREPSVAFVGHESSAVMAWTRDDGVERTVRFVVRGQNFLPERAVPRPAGAHDWRPDVGGALPGTPAGSALIVLQRELSGAAFTNTDQSIVVGQLVDAGAASAAAATMGQEILAGGGYDNERPSVNQTGEGTPDHAWLVAWQAFPPGPLGPSSTWLVNLRKVSRFGFATAPSWLPTSPQRHDVAPQVAGDDGRFLVACGASDVSALPGKPLGAGSSELRAYRVDWPSTAPWPSFPSVDVTLDAAASPALEPTGCSFDRTTRGHWAVAVRDGATGEQRVHTLGYRGLSVAIDPILPGAPGLAPARCGISYDEHNARHVIATGTADGGGGGGLVLAALALPPAPPASTSAPSCSAAGIGWLGPQSIGSDRGQVVVAGAEPSALHVLLVATAPASIPLHGAPWAAACTLLVPAAGPDFLGTLALGVGQVATWAVPLPEGLPPIDLAFQGVHTAAGLAELRTTARLTVPLR